MPLYIEQSGDVDRCYRCLTDSQTLKDKATQLLIKYKSGALVTQKRVLKRWLLLLNPTLIGSGWSMKDELDNKECNHFFVFLEKMQMLELIIENVEILLEFGWSETNDIVMSPYVGEKGNVSWNWSLQKVGGRRKVGSFWLSIGN